MDPSVAPKPVINWELLMCPSDPRPDPVDPSKPHLAYAVNCGVRNWVYGPLTDAAGRQYHLGGGDRPLPPRPPGDPTGLGYEGGEACGVFHVHDQRVLSDDRPAEVTRVGIDYISQHDGTSYTLVLSENLSNRCWTGTDLVEVYDTSSTNPGQLALLWDPTWEPEYGAAGRLPNPPGINMDKEGDHARPSSYHPGGVLASYADGRVKFASEGIDYFVYQNIMTPWGQKAGKLAQMKGWDGSDTPPPGFSNLIMDDSGQPTIFDPAKL